MLLLFKPWSSWEEFTAWATNWEEVFNEFIEHDELARYRIRNTQIQSQCRSAALDSVQSNMGESRMGEVEAFQTETISRNEEGDPEALGEDELLVPVPWTPSAADTIFSDGAIAAGLQSGLLTCPIDDQVNGVPYKAPRTVGVAERTAWGTTPIATPNSEITHDEDVPAAASISTATIIPDYELASTTPTVCVAPIQSTVGLPTLEEPSQGLNMKQLLAFQIIQSHVDLLPTDGVKPQLLMKVMGDPGTGKSTVIWAVTLLFQSRNRSPALEKVAHSGIAAHMIGGKTVCVGFKIVPLRRKQKPDEAGRDRGDGDIVEYEYKFSASAIQQLVEMWDQVEYLIIDEISQVSITRKRPSSLGLTRYKAWK